MDWRFTILHEGRLEMDRRQRLAYRLGRWPTDEEFEEDKREESRKLSDEKNARDRKNAEARAALWEQEAERKRLIEARRRSREKILNDPHTITSADQLKQAVLNGRANCSNTIIEGLPNEPVVIDGDLEALNLSHSRFTHVRFSNVNMNQALLIDCKFEDVAFGPGSTIERADFFNSEFRSVKFNPECKMGGASFRSCQFGSSVKIEFDHNSLLNATFQGGRRDEWFKLSHSYAGFIQFVNITLSGTYFSLILLKLYLFNIISQVQAEPMAAFDAALKAIRKEAQKLGPGISGHLEAAIPKFKEVSPFDFVFGSDDASLGVAIIILVYQSLRLFITMRIGPLMEAERMGGYTPNRVEFEHYIDIHRIVQFLSIVALLLFAFELWQLFTQNPIQVPSKT
jgi:uncharacterized protein YjbI with pentapeptide repeats